VQIYPAPPSGEIFDNLFVWITSPMQGVWGNGGNGPWGKSHISTDTNGKATVNFDISTFSGYWNIGLYFEGQYFANNTIYYQPGDWQRGFTVLPAKTPTPSPTATPAPSPIPTSAPTPTPTLPNMGPTSPPTLISTDLTVTLALVAIAVVVISVISLLLFVRHLKRNIPKPDSSTI
jgi:hypothetical protein